MTGSMNGMYMVRGVKVERVESSNAGNDMIPMLLHLLNTDNDSKSRQCQCPSNQYVQNQLTARQWQLQMSMHDMSMSSVDVEVVHE
jgi:hypothetical protein